MDPEPQAAELTPLLGGPPQPSSAAQVVEHLRLWEPRPPTSPPTRRPLLLLNMVCTADGRATLGGRSGPIGNRADREFFHALRTAVDAVLVGAGTVRAERYGGLVRDEAPRRLRHARGLAEEPLACIVSASLDLAPDIPLLADPAARIAVLTPSPAGELPGSIAPAGERSRSTAPAHESSRSTAPTGERSDGAAPVEYIRAARDGRLDLPAALAELHTRLRVRTVLCEGGPGLNGQLLAAGLVDELFLSLAPKLAGGADPGAALRIVSGPELDPPLELELLDVLESDSQLMLRYRVGGAAPRRPPAV
jgi:riboflavin biosynthesis pyrimidine reductase